MGGKGKAAFCFDVYLGLHEGQDAAQTINDALQAVAGGVDGVDDVAAFPGLGNDLVEHGFAQPLDEGDTRP